MFANAESANHFSYPVFQTFHCPVIQVIPMIMRNHQIIDIRHIFRFIDISSFKWFVDERYRRSHAKNRINEKSLSIYLNKVGRMSKPDQYIFITPQLMQIRFDNRNFILRTQVLCFAEQERKHCTKASFVRGHHLRRMQIIELAVTVMR